MSIAAYADPELPATMMSLLSAADRPELIRFGIVAGLHEISDERELCCICSERGSSGAMAAV